MKNEARFTIFVEDYNVPPQPWLLWGEVFSYDVYKMTKNKLYLDSLFIFERDKVYWGPDKKQFLALGVYFFNRLNKEKNFLAELLININKSLDNIEKFCDLMLKTNFSTFQNRELLKIYNKFCRLWIEAARWGAIPMYMEMNQVTISDKIKKDLSDKLKPYGKLEIVFSKLVTPLKETYLSRENKDVLLSANKFKSDHNIWRSLLGAKDIKELPLVVKAKLKYLVKRYAWMQYYYYGQAADINYYLDLIRKNGVAAKRKLKNKQKTKVDLRNWQKKIMKSLDEDDRNKIIALQEFAYTKELRKEIQAYRLNYAMHNWFVEVGKRLHCSSLQVKYLTRIEIENYLQNKIEPSIDELNRRYRYSAFLMIRQKEQVNSGDKAKKMEKLFIKDKVNINNVNKLVGTVAYPGKLKGTVKIVNATKDLAKFNKGDILVSFSTNPSLISAMNKAAAIITDAGGITCHAAIVSRELEVPAIVGTKIATKVLQDGDLIEVDANLGEIKILNKVKN